MILPITSLSLSLVFSLPPSLSPLKRLDYVVCLSDSLGEAVLWQVAAVAQRERNPKGRLHLLAHVRTRSGWMIADDSKDRAPSTLFKDKLKGATLFFFVRKQAGESDA